MSYYQQSIAVYEQIAKTDPGHDGEALYWAQRERVHARGIEARMTALLPA
ncbi:MAG: AMED_5909 family protein [Pseudonocardiaceae bacterium]